MVGAGTVHYGIVLWLTLVDQSEPVAEPYGVGSHQGGALRRGRERGRHRQVPRGDWQKHLTPVVMKEAFFIWCPTFMILSWGKKNHHVLLFLRRVTGLYTHYAKYAHYQLLLIFAPSRDALSLSRSITWRDRYSSSSLVPFPAPFPTLSTPLLKQNGLPLFLSCSKSFFFLLEFRKDYLFLFIFLKNQKTDAG